MNPRQALWAVGYAAALLSGKPPLQAKRFADQLLADYETRWPESEEPSEQDPPP